VVKWQSRIGQTVFTSIACAITYDVMYSSHNVFAFFQGDPASTVDAFGLFRNPNWPPIKVPPGGPRPPGPGIGNWIGVAVSIASSLIDVDCQGTCSRTECEACCKIVAGALSALNATGFVAGCVGSGGLFCVVSDIAAVLAEQDIINDLNFCMLQCRNKYP